MRIFRAIATLIVGSIIIGSVFLTVALVGNFFVQYQDAFRVAVSTQEQTAQIRKVAERDILIENELKHLLDQNPDTLFARVSIIYDFTRKNVANVPILRIDNTHIAFGPNTAISEQKTDIPISQWSGEIGDLAADRCVVRHVNDLDNRNYKTRLQSAGVKSFVGCPLQSKSQIYGALFLTWPDDEPTERLMQTVENVHASAHKVSHLFGADED